VLEPPEAPPAAPAAREAPDRLEAALTRSHDAMLLAKLMCGRRQCIPVGRLTTTRCRSPDGRLEGTVRQRPNVERTPFSGTLELLKFLKAALEPHQRITRSGSGHEGQCGA
jgi:hypothetical protein